MIHEHFMNEETMAKLANSELFIAESWHQNSFKFVGLPFGMFQFHAFLLKN